MKKYLYKFFILSLALLMSRNSFGQEFNANIVVLTQQISNNANKSIFTTLRTQLNDFINNRKWTGDNFQPQEKINCNFLLNITAADPQGICKATLTVQAARKIYHSDYQSPLINYQDQDIDFRYVQYQALNFNPTTPFGSDALNSNLTAVIAFYINYILGLSYGSYSLNGGAPYFKIANNIVNAAPSTKEISGWTSFDGMRNRYWLSENIMNPRYADLPNVLYTYYREGMDHLYDNYNEGRTGVLKSLEKLQDINRQNPNSMFVQQFVLGKTTELEGIFKEAAPDVKNNALQALVLLDPANANKYNTTLK